MICASRDGDVHPQFLFPPMTSLKNTTQQLQLDKRSSIHTVVLETLASPERGREGKGGANDHGTHSVHFVPSPVSQLNTEGSGSLYDLTSARVWRNRVIWRAGASVLTSERTSTNYFVFQIIEGLASGSLNFLSGLIVATLSTWPTQAIPVGILFGNTILVSLIISATISATGGHINSMITMATAFSGLCYPVRAIVYISFQLLGGALGGTLLRVALGKDLSQEIHNASCWIEPKGDVNVWQASLIEFTSAFILLYVTLLFFARADRIHRTTTFYHRFLGYGVGLDPRQAKLFGAKYGPVLVGLVVGLL